MIMRVGILGYGTVGKALVEVLFKNKDLIQSKCNEEIIPIIALARTKKENSLIPVVCDIDEFLKVDVDVYVELMGGIDNTFSIIKKILLLNKPIVSANKAMLAYYRYEIENLSNKAFKFEASVAGGIPIIKILKEGLSANNILHIKGILNGTSNYILTKMFEDNTQFDLALKQAQDLGYAEADTSLDINGMDAAHKLLILSSIAYGLNAKPEDILVEGIENINTDDIYFANEFEYVIKHLALAKINDNKLELRVHPCMISKDTLLSKVNGVMNAINIKGDLLGESLYYGAGAGGEATASAVVSDLIDIALNRLKSITFNKNSNLTLLNKDDIYTKYYLRINVEDKIGVLSKITQIMINNNISVESFLQKPSKNISILYFITHFTYEKNIQNLLYSLKEQDFIKNEPFMMRIE